MLAQQNRNLLTFFDDSYNCDVCSEQFATIAELRKHLKSHNEVASSDCDIQENHNEVATYNCENQEESDCIKSEESDCIKSEEFDCIMSEESDCVKSATETNINPHKCLSCNKSYSRGDKLRQHNLVHHGVKPYSCDICQTEFSRIFELKQHVQKHSEEVSCDFEVESTSSSRRRKRCICEVCKKVFSRSDHLKRHWRRKHTGESSGKSCNPESQKKDDNLSIGDSKIKSKLKIKSMRREMCECEVCKKVFTRFYDLKRHMRTHTRESLGKRSNTESQKTDDDLSTGDSKIESKSQRKERCVCEVCKKVFSRFYDLKRHWRTHTGESSGKRSNPESQKTDENLCIGNDSFDKQRNDLKESAPSNDEEKRCACEVCQKDFAKLYYLKRHGLKHAGEPSQKISNLESQKLDDNLCSNDSFDKQRNDLRKSCPSNDGGKRCACEVCQKDFAKFYSLKRHSLKHTGESSQMISNLESQTPDNLYSNYSFDSQRTDLRKSVGRTRHICDVCQKEFTDFYKLKRHGLTHTREKPVSCGICQKTFSRPEHLRRHELIHSGQKSFVCIVCQRAFHRSEHLKSHEMTHLRERKKHRLRKHSNEQS